MSSHILFIFPYVILFLRLWQRGKSLPIRGKPLFFTPVLKHRSHQEKLLLISLQAISLYKKQNKYQPVAVLPSLLVQSQQRLF